MLLSCSWLVLLQRSATNIHGQTAAQFLVIVNGFCYSIQITGIHNLVNSARQVRHQQILKELILTLARNSRDPAFPWASSSFLRSAALLALRCLMALLLTSPSDPLIRRCEVSHGSSTAPSTRLKKQIQDGIQILMWSPMKELNIGH